MPANAPRNDEEVEGIGSVDGVVADTRGNITTIDATTAVVAREASQHAEKVGDVDQAVEVHVAVLVGGISADAVHALFECTDVAVVAFRIAVARAAAVVRNAVRSLTTRRIRCKTITATLPTVDVTLEPSAMSVSGSGRSWPVVRYYFRWPAQQPKI